MYNIFYSNEMHQNQRGMEGKRKVAVPDIFQLCHDDVAPIFPDKSWNRNKKEFGQLEENWYGTFGSCWSRHFSQKSHLFSFTHFIRRQSQIRLRFCCRFFRVSRLGTMGRRSGGGVSRSISGRTISEEGFLLLLPQSLSVAVQESWNTSSEKENERGRETSCCTSAPSFWPVL